jgi:hypothetical protein
MIPCNKPLVLSEEDLKEIYSLFTSSTKYEREQVYDEHSEHYFLNVRLADEYSLTEEKREYALDAWRAVVYFLHLKGYSLCKDGQEVNLSLAMKNL